MKRNLIVVLGPTASGKTSLAVKLAYRFNGEILSADSRQVYKGMDIGTGKDLNEYVVNDTRINYHLIDIAEPSEEFNLFLYKEKFIEAYNDIKERKKIPILTGGTGMYLSAIIEDYMLNRGDFSEEKKSEIELLTDEELKNKILAEKQLHNITDIISRERMIKAVQSLSGLGQLSFPLNCCIIGVQFDRDELKKRITDRLKQRLEAGMLNEVKELIDSGVSTEKLLFFGLEYKYIALYLSGKLNFNDMFQKLNSSIHDFAKRQMTWYRKMEKNGVKINWVQKGDYNQSEKIIKVFLRNEEQN